MKAMTIIFYEELREPTIELTATLTFTVNAINGGFLFTLDEMKLTGNSFTSKCLPRRSNDLFHTRGESLAHAEQLVQKYLREGFDYKMTNESLLAANAGDRTWIEQFDDQIAHSEDADTKARLELQRSTHVDNTARRELQIEYRASRTES